MDRKRYRDLDKDDAQRDPTRRLRKNSRIYCLVWTENDLFKVGLGSGKNTRDASALRSVTKHFAHVGVTLGRPDGWRADLPALDGRAWGDGQRFEMVFATALSERLEAGAARDVGFEWFCGTNLHLVQWEEELREATVRALDFSGLEQSTVEWVKQLSPLASEPHGGAGGSSQRNAWRTTRNKRGECAMKDCGALVSEQDVRQDGFLYCSEAHATVDRQSDTGPAVVHVA